MKPLMLLMGSLALTLSLAQTASAACFNFINGKGPTEISDIALASQARKVCFTRVNGFGGSFTQVDLADESGSLARFTAKEVARGRCLGTCQVYELESGNVDGENVNVRGIVLTAAAELDRHLNITIGTLDIQANARAAANRYLIQGGPVSAAR